MNWLSNRCPKWSSLRAIRSYKIVESTYIWLLIVPAAVKVTQRLNNPLVFEWSGNRHQLDVSLPFSWEILFLSALAFTIGNALFLLFAPMFIRDFKEFGDFSAKGGTINQIAEYSDKGATTHYKRMECLAQWAGILPSTTSKEDERKYYFWKLFSRENSKRPLLRIIVTASYSLGFLLFLWLVVTNIYYAIGVMYA